MFGKQYFDWMKKVRELLGKTSGPDDSEDFLAMCNDISWFGCYDDGFTPEEAVKKFSTKTMN